LNKDSGLRALCGDNDMRSILRRVDNADSQAQLALDIYCQRIRKYIGAYLALLGRVDALIFTGGIGEHAAAVRQAITNNLQNLGIQLDESANAAIDGAICPIHLQPAEATGHIPLLVIRTNEELEIARQTRLLCSH
jgi:acetate kinase